MTRRRNDRLYQRGDGRWYADFRDLGGGREALIPKSSNRATQDRDVAVALLAERITVLDDRRRDQELRGLTRTCTLGEYAGQWLDDRRATDTRSSTLARYELAFHQLFKVLDPGTRMDRLTVADVRKALKAAKAIPSRKGGGLSSASLRQMMAGMRQVFEAAMIDGVIPYGMNPWAHIPKGERPKPRQTTTEFLEVPEVAALIDCLCDVKTRHVPLVTVAKTLLLTGGRLDEVLGLELSDVDFRRQCIHFRTNKWRKLKRGVERVVPLWPQLAEELRSYLNTKPRIGSALLFPGYSVQGVEQMLTGKFYSQIERAAFAAGITKHVTPQVFRVTYCAARLQTLDGGQPVALFTVRKEMGHFSMAMIERVYGRVGSFRHRADVVEYIFNADASSAATA